jgi:serine/threonine protein kinase
VPLNQLIETIALKDAMRHILVLAHTLRYIHAMKVVHRDIKPANVLITPSGPKLFDFGLAKWKEDDLKANNFGTKCYKSPEVVLQMGQYG